MHGCCGQIVDEFDSERSVLSDNARLSPHPHIMTIFHSFTTTVDRGELPDWEFDTGLVHSRTMVLVMPFFPRDLKTALNSVRKAGGTCFAAQRAARVGTHLLDAVDHLKRHRILHRDIKLDNILLKNPDTSAESAVLSDFGHSFDLRQNRIAGFKVEFKYKGFTRGGAPAFLAPEIGLARPGPDAVLDYYKSDEWAVGLVLHQLLAGASHGHDSSVFAGFELGSGALQNWLQDADSQYIPVAESTPRLAQVVRNLLRVRAEDRSCAKDALKLLRAHTKAEADETRKSEVQERKRAAAAAQKLEAQARADTERRAREEGRAAKAAEIKQKQEEKKRRKAANTRLNKRRGGPRQQAAPRFFVNDVRSYVVAVLIAAFASSWIYFSRPAQDIDRPDEHSSGESLNDLKWLTEAYLGLESNDPQAAARFLSDQPINSEHKFSKVSIVDHLVQVTPGTETGLDQLAKFAVSGNTAVLASQQVKMLKNGLSAGENAKDSQRLLLQSAEAGNPTAQYLWGKILAELEGEILVGPHVSNTRVQRLEGASRYWFYAAASGHAYAMAKLGRLFNEHGQTSDAINWWSRALAHAAIPEAAYNLGVCFGTGHNGTPRDYELAAKYYSHAAQIDLTAHGVRSTDPFGVPFKILNLITPNNDDQAGYQHLSVAALKSPELRETVLTGSTKRRASSPSWKLGSKHLKNLDDKMNRGLESVAVQQAGCRVWLGLMDGRSDAAEGGTRLSAPDSQENKKYLIQLLSRNMRDTTMTFRLGIAAQRQLRQPLMYTLGFFAENPSFSYNGDATILKALEMSVNDDLRSKPSPSSDILGLRPEGRSHNHTSGLWCAAAVMRYREMLIANSDLEYQQVKTGRKGARTRAIRAWVAVRKIILQLGEFADPDLTGWPGIPHKHVCWGLKTCLTNLLDTFSGADGVALLRSAASPVVMEKLKDTEYIRRKQTYEEGILGDPNNPGPNHLDVPRKLRRVTDAPSEWGDDRWMSSLVRIGAFTNMVMRNRPFNESKMDAPYEKVRDAQIVIAGMESAQHGMSARRKLSKRQQQELGIEKAGIEAAIAEVEALMQASMTAYKHITWDVDRAASIVSAGGVSAMISILLDNFTPDVANLPSDEMLLTADGRVGKVGAWSVRRTVEENLGKAKSFSCVALATLVARHARAGCFVPDGDTDVVGELDHFVWDRATDDRTDLGQNASGILSPSRVQPCGADIGSNSERLILGKTREKIPDMLPPGINFRGSACDLSFQA